MKLSILSCEMYYWKKIFNPKSCLLLPVAKKKTHSVTGFYPWLHLVLIIAVHCVFGCGLQLVQNAAASFVTNDKCRNCIAPSLGWII